MALWTKIDESLSLFWQNKLNQYFGNDNILDRVCMWSLKLLPPEYFLVTNQVLNSVNLERNQCSSWNFLKSHVSSFFTSKRETKDQ